jgi:hypothetical protein
LSRRPRWGARLGRTASSSGRRPSPAAAGAMAASHGVFGKYSWQKAGNGWYSLLVCGGKPGAERPVVKGKRAGGGERVKRAAGAARGARRAARGARRGAQAARARARGRGRAGKGTAGAAASCAPRAGAKGGRRAARRGRGAAGGARPGRGRALRWAAVHARGVRGGCGKLCHAGAFLAFFGVDGVGLGLGFGAGRDGRGDALFGSAGQGRRGRRARAGAALRLRLRPPARASAERRRGRAGVLRAGACTRRCGWA